MNDRPHTPHSIEAEQSVLGALLHKPDALDDIANLIDAGMFYRSGHAVMFSTISAMVNESNVVDVVTVAERLDRDGYLTTSAVWPTWRNWRTTFHRRRTSSGTRPSCGRSGRRAVSSPSAMRWLTRQ